MLYYFGVPNGAGFQAFFRNSGTLVIATVTKRGEFISLCLQDCPLTHSAWVSILLALYYTSMSLVDSLNYEHNTKSSQLSKAYLICTAYWIISMVAKFHVF